MSHVVHLGDCLEGMAAMADGSVDVVLTDPPYSEGLYARTRTNRGHGRRPNGRPVSKADRTGQNGALAMASLAIGAIDPILDAAAAQFLRLARRWIVVFHDSETGDRWRIAFGDAYVRTGCWAKTDPMPQVTGDRPAQGFEACTIAYASPGRMRWNGGGRPALWIGGTTKGAERDHNHPCPKPLWLMELLVRDFTDPGELVLDPFAGSGTTGVACKRLGRRFVGFERDARYHAIAERRLALAREQLGLWDGAA